MSLLDRAGTAANIAWRSPIRTLRWRIVVPYAVLTIIVAAIGSYLALDSVTGSLEERFTNHLVEASRVGSDAVVRRERAQLATLRSISFTDGLAAAVESGDRAAVGALVEPIAANNRSEFVQVIDARGNLVFGTRLAGPDSLEFEPVTTLPQGVSDMVAWVLGGSVDSLGDKQAAIVETESGYYLFTAGPVAGTGGVAGVVLVGTSIESVAAAIKAESLADVELFGPGSVVLASTFAADQRAMPEPPLLSTLGGRPARAHGEAAGRGYDLLYSPLTIRGKTQGVIAVGLSSDFIGTAGASTVTRMVFLFAGVAVLVLALGWFVAWRLTGPLQHLLNAARSLAAGDLSARADIRTPDEIGELAVTFDGMAAQLQLQHLATMSALASAIDARDPYTAGHSVRVGNLSVELGRELGMSRADLHHLQVGGILHDIGKIGIRDSVLLKEGRLTDEERRIIQQHPTIGLRILGPTNMPREVLSMVGGHHERLNGSGYPLGLSADQLTIYPRITAVADVYDALTTDRPYRAAMNVKEALALLDREGKQGLLDGDVISAMIRIAKYWEEYRRSGPLRYGIRMKDGGRRAA